MRVIAALAVMVVGQVALPEAALAATVPSPPGKPTAAVNVEADNWVYLNWTPPTDGGGLPHLCYIWTRHPDGKQGEPLCSNSTFDVDKTAQRGKTYTYTVVSTNSLGASAPSEESDPVLIPASPPNVMSKPTVTAGSRTLTITWTKPYDGGSPIIGFDVEVWRNGGPREEGTITTTDADAQTATVSGLKPGTDYRVIVTAFNSVGSSEDSPAVDIRTQAEPPELTGPPVVQWDGSVTWPPAINNGGDVSYTVTASPGGMKWSTSSTHVVPAGLPAGRTYTFTLVAKNYAGSSAPSEPSNPLVLPAVKPDKVTNVQVSLGDETATVTWTPPVNDGGPLLHYRVYATRLGGSTPPPDISTTVPPDQTTATLTGLTNGDWYSFTVEATNEAGTSSASSSYLQVPRVVPENPGYLTTSLDGTTLTVSWDPPPDNGSPITGYTVTMDDSGAPDSPASSVVRELGPDDTSVTFTDLARGSVATVVVTATNARGTSEGSMTQVSIPALAPDTMAAPTAVRGDRSARVSWSAPAMNGGQILLYTVTVYPGGRTLTAPGNASSLLVDGLVNGASYTFAVTATNSAGTSEYSPVSAAVVPAGHPGKVSGVRAILDGRSVIIKWAAATANGSPITKYVVVRDPGADRSVGANVRKTRFKRLARGVYDFRVVAVNAVGHGVASTTVRVRVR